MVRTCTRRKFMDLTLLFCGCLLLLHGCGEKTVEIIPPVVFQPVPGGVSGSEIRDNLVVTVLDRGTGKPLAGAQVYVHQGNPPVLIAELETDAAGMADFTSQEMIGPVTVTAICEVDVAYDTLTIRDINASRVEMPLRLRKKQGKTRLTMQFEGIKETDRSLALFRNKNPFKPIDLDPESNENPGENYPVVKRTIYCQPLGMSALLLDETGEPVGFGGVIRPAGPPARSTPIAFPIQRITDKNMKTMTGKLTVPSNMDLPENGWEPDNHFMLTVISSGGICGPVVSGLGSIDKNRGYQASLLNIPKLGKPFVVVSIRNGHPGTAQVSTAFLYHSGETTSEIRDISLKKVPAGTSIEKKTTDIYPEFRWDPAEGNLRKCTLSHQEYNFNWEIYDRGDSDKAHLTIPPLEPGSPGALIPGEIYSFRVESMTVEDLNYNHWTFASLEKGLRYRTAGYPMKFKMEVAVTGTPAPASGTPTPVPDTTAPVPDPTESVPDTTESSPVPELTPGTQ